jgi:hypothetical protein
LLQEKSTASVVKDMKSSMRVCQATLLLEAFAGLVASGGRPGAIVALGGNDNLRGLSVAEMKQNLTQIIETALPKNVVVILAEWKRRRITVRNTRRVPGSTVTSPCCSPAVRAVSARQGAGQAASTSRMASIPIHKERQSSDTVWNVLEPLLDQISVS